MARPPKLSSYSCRAQSRLSSIACAWMCASDARQVRLPLGPLRPSCPSRLSRSVTSVGVSALSLSRPDLMLVSWTLGRSCCRVLQL